MRITDFSRYSAEVDGLPWARTLREREAARKTVAEKDAAFMAELGIAGDLSPEPEPVLKPQFADFRPRRHVPHDTDQPIEQPTHKKEK